MAKNKKQSGIRGVGDTIAKVTDILGIEQCDGCKERQDALNRLFPFKRPVKPNEEDIVFLTDLFSWYNGIPIPMEKANDIKQAELVWMRLFNVKTESCSTCGIQYQNAYKKDLKTIYDATMDN